MSADSWIAIGVSSCALITVVVSFVLLRINWNRVAANYPAEPPLADAVCRRFQTCSMGLFNLGWSVNILADQERLHLQPALFLRAATSRGMSIPWDEVMPEEKRVLGRYCAFHIDNRRFLTPAWVADIANAKRE